MQNKTALIAWFWNYHSPDRHQYVSIFLPLSSCCVFSNISCNYFNKTISRGRMLSRVTTLETMRKTFINQWFHHNIKDVFLIFLLILFISSVEIKQTIFRKKSSVGWIFDLHKEENSCLQHLQFDLTNIN